MRDMKPKPKPPPPGPQHEVNASFTACWRCGKGLQQIEHGAECVSDEAVALGLLWQRMRRAGEI
jgi:hypothetical protein